MLTGIDILLMLEKGIWGGICHTVHWYAKTNNKYMIKFDRSYEGKNDEGCFLKVDLPEKYYPEKLRELHNDLPFLPEKKWKLKKSKKFLLIYIIKLNMLLT